jgi:putative DNA primase/helicase
MWAYDNGKFVERSEDWLGAVLGRKARNLYTKKNHSETIHFTRLRTQGDFNTVHTPRLFGMANGVLDVKEGKLLEHSPEHKLRHLSPITYNPDVKNTILVDMIKNVTPEWDDLLNVMAALLIDTQFKHWAFLVGPGGTGLSRMVKIISNLVGKDAICITAPDVLKKNQFAAKELLNAKVLINTEAEGTRLETEFIKRLTGGDPLRAESKYGSAFSFYPACTPITTTNQPEVPAGDR